MELVSIIMPCHNAEKFIAKAILSIQNQTYNNWELLIVDDASTDKTVQIVNSFSDQRIQLFFLKENQGAGYARNFATQKSTGKYIAFLDADDEWKPQKIEIQIKFMKENNLPITFSYYELINEEGQLLNKVIKSPSEINFQKLMYCNWIGNLTGIYDTSFLGKIPISNQKKRQDWILWLDIAKKVESIIPVPESLAYYRVRKNSISSNKIKLLKYNYQVYRNYHKISPFYSFLSLLKFLYIHFTKKAG